MASLRFPSGYPVEIDETRIWRQLSDWLRQTGCDVRLSRGDDNRFAAVLGKMNGDLSGRVWKGHSRLSIGDAVAQALQTAVSEGP